MPRRPQKQRQMFPTSAPAPQHERGPFLPPPQKCPTFAAMLCLMPIQRRIICRPISGEELTPGRARTELYPRRPSFFMHGRRLTSCHPVERSTPYGALDAGLTLILNRCGRWSESRFNVRDALERRDLHTQMCIGLTRKNVKSTCA
jgi:hypothetical protein